MNARFTSSAEAELQEAIAFYEAAENGLGTSSWIGRSGGGAHPRASGSLNADVSQNEALRASVLECGG